MAATHRVLESTDSPFSIEVDAQTGLPRHLMVEDRLGVLTQPVGVSLEFDVGGTEKRHPTGGLMYEDTEVLADIVPSGVVTRVHKGTCVEYRQAATAGALQLTLIYRIYPTAPHAELAVLLASSDTVLVRNATLTVSLPAGADALVNVPGNMLRRDLALSDLGERPAGVSPIGGLRGSSGIIGVSTGEATAVVWPNNPTEIPDVSLRYQGGSAITTVQTNFAAEISPASSAELLLVTLDLGRGGFARVREHWPAWASRYGLTSPNDPPEWMHAAGIYEVQIGTSYFWKNNAYCRYEEIRDLIADLDRVQRLGFSVIQLMPRQPYPSYNVHDYADVTVSYGDEAELRELVRSCHERGMRIILDVLLHGVLDNESIDSAVEGVLQGPLYEKLDGVVEDTLASDLSEDDNYWIAWSRHILDFSEYWRGGSPARTPLQETHPEWFATDSQGRVSGVYTKAFDARSPSWQRFFRDAMLHLVREYDVDGFRFDAPTYNFFANWAPWARSRAFMSPLGCIPLFVDMRHDLKELKPSALMYTEPSGHLLRRSMDVNYNYDEQWLVTALMTGRHAQRAVRNARDFMQWMEDRDDFLPPGSHTAHHIDSHDTFWWPQWGKKWRRDQFPLAAVRALTATFLSVDGPYMMFTGGEEGIEQTLEGLLAFRRDHRHLWSERAVFDTSSDPSGHLVIARRGSTGEATLCVVNLSADETVALPEAYASGWNHVVAEGVTGGVVAPFGYLFAVAAG